jgi:ATP-dependent helicase HrpA
MAAGCPKGFYSVASAKRMAAGCPKGFYSGFAMAPQPSRSRSADRRRALAAARAASVPQVSYPDDLPIAQARDEIAAALRASQVLVVAGETGSGKTTQLPKICLELGRGVAGVIGHTQPRRIAARAVAERVAEELNVELGAQVGYQVRFTDQSSDRSLIKVMTDGVLLAEIQRDRMLRGYDTIIVDEAHERSLNIDFLLGYLHQLLPRRPDLKLIITSATIDPHRFAQHFANAPVIEVSGRTYPVEVRYRPLDAPEEPERDQVQGIVDAVAELADEPPGDVLVFLSGEREIRDTADALRGLKLTDTEIVPLYARLSAAEQHRVFQPHSGRRIVLATNVAETSLTVPGIRYVVDPGTARISRYSNRTKVQRLPIEPVSQASADQRKGRCGRVAEGVCIRLYSEEDFAARPAFTDPEILRTNLASVILQMTALGLGDVEAFGFIDPPDRRSVRDAVQLLHELGAIESDASDEQPRLTPVGRTLAKLPVDPRLGRMLVDADRNACLREVLVIVAALSIQDPRERPTERQQSADELHARFADKRSDFLAWLNLWTYLRDQQHALSSNQFRRLCRTEHLHYLRVREWQDLHSQLRRSAKDAGMHINESPAEADAVHRSLLAGLLSHVGLRQGDSREYAGARGTRFWLWPGSALAKSPPDWVMAAELVETSRLWGRTAARIDPAWVEKLAGHLVKRTYSELRWSARRGSAVADERVTLYGVPLVSGRTVAYGAIDKAVSRELFIRHALVEGEWRTQHPFLRHNRALLDELTQMEERARRRDIVIDDDALFDFYDQRIPPRVVSTRHFDSWWRKRAARDPELLSLTPEAVLGAREATDGGRDYPDVWRHGEIQLSLRYRFAPGEADDGLTVHVPLAVLNRVAPHAFDWQVEGFREELVTALLRSLPKDLRRQLVPVPDVVREIMPRLVPDGGLLTDALARAVRDVRGVVIPPQAWDRSRVPAHLQPTFRVEDAGRVVAQGKDLAALQERLAPAMRAAVTQTVDDLETSGLRAWTIGTLPRHVQRTRDGHTVEGFPALVDEGATVGVRVLLSPLEQRRAMWLGTRRLLLLSAPPPAKTVHDRLDQRTRLLLTRTPHGSVGGLLADCHACAVDDLMAAHGGPVWDGESFATLRTAVVGGLEAALVDIVRQVAAVLAAAHEAEARLNAAVDDPSVADARAQLSRLVFDGFVTVTGRRRLKDLVRYVTAIQRRMDKLRSEPSRDRAAMATIEVVEGEYHALLARAPEAVADPAVQEIRWMIEELRVSLFAQQLGTRYPVSDTRVFRALAAVDV